MTGDETIRKVAERLHSSYCECEGWHEECQGPHDGDRRVARRLYEGGLLAPAPLREEWGVRWDDHDIWGHYLNLDEAVTGAGDEGTPVHRWVTDWETP